MIELKSVSFRYGTDASGSEDGGTRNEASLTDISLTVRDGEFVLLTGPSGCGKTTVLRLINGLIPQFYPGEVTGEIRIDGESTAGVELYDLAPKVGTVFQNPRTQFYNVDTTGELAFGCENRGIAEEEIYARIDETVSRFRIEALMDRSIFNLSDGEKQKIACASVDVSGPGIILLDEPSANLDYASTLSLRACILRWRSEGKTIVAVEHRIAYLWDLIDRAVILRDGRIVKELSGDEKDGVTDADLEALGLRSRVTEDPEAIPLPAFSDGDEPIILRNLRFAYPGTKKAVVDIPELKLAAGEITAVVGHNGAGKTTFLNCLCGLERRCGGTLEFRGERYDRRARRRLCFLVMQDTGNQLFTETALDEVLISLPKEEPEPEKRAVEIFGQLDLGEFRDRHPQSLSGGQKQRLAIACALASGRKILLLDEPTSGLDHGHMKETATLFEKLRAMGTTLLVVTHDSELIRACCTRKIRI